MFCSKWHGKTAEHWYREWDKRDDDAAFLQKRASQLEAENAQLIAQLAAVREAAGCSDTACTGKVCGGEDKRNPIDVRAEQLMSCPQRLVRTVEWSWPRKGVIEFSIHGTVQMEFVGDCCNKGFQ